MCVCRRLSVCVCAFQFVFVFVLVRACVRACLCPPAPVDEGADWFVGARPAGVQVSPVPGLHQTHEVGTFSLVQKHGLRSE